MMMQNLLTSLNHFHEKNKRLLRY